MIGLGSVKATVARSASGWRPPPKLTVSEWADKEFVLSAESSAQPGRWTTISYQREILDAFSDPRVSFISVMKSARIGWTKILNIVIGYSIHQDPASTMLVQPTGDDAKGYSKEEIAPMLRDVPVLKAIAFEDVDEKIGPKESGNTIMHKRFPGMILSLTGANSGTGFRRISRKRVLLDEVDAYPESAGSDGDPVKLATKRAETFWDRKIGAGSTPLLEGASRIKQLFLAGDQRRYHVPCPECGHFDYLVFRPTESGEGHYMTWPEDKPEQAHFVCSKNGCVIEHKNKRDMLKRGHWLASEPFTNHASFHIWAAYSVSPNSTWGDIAREFLEANRNGPAQLKTFINTVLGETWAERGDAPDWQRLYLRREGYKIGTVSDGVKFITAGVDVQKDRFVYEIVGWGYDKESWSIDAGVIPCDTGRDESWRNIDELIGRIYESSRGPLPIRMTAVDSGYNTNMVYSYARRHVGRVIATKGVDKQHAILGAPSPVDVTISGRRIARGCKMWPVGVGPAKTELYGWLRIDPPTKESGLPFPIGFCHFPEHPEDFFKQLTAEHLVKVAKRTGHTIQEWQVIPGRENHWLDCRVYARAAAYQLGLDRMKARAPQPPPPGAVVVGAPAPAAASPTPAPQPAPQPKLAKPVRSDYRFTIRKNYGKGWLSR